VAALFFLFHFHLFLFSHIHISFLFLYIYFFLSFFLVLLLLLLLLLFFFWPLLHSSAGGAQKSNFTNDDDGDVHRCAVLVYCRTSARPVTWSAPSSSLNFSQFLSIFSRFSLGFSLFPPVCRRSELIVIAAIIYRCSRD